MAEPLPKAEIRTARLLLRPLHDGDAEPMFALFANWEVARWLSAPPWPYTRSDAEAFIHRCMAGGPDAEAALAITHDGTLVGSVGVRMRAASHLQRGDGPNIGYWIGEPYWGRGYMTEALAGIVGHVFATRPDDAIYCGAFTHNVASLRVQEKVGFERDGETMLHSTPRGGDFPHINTMLTRARFSKVPG